MVSSIYSMTTITSTSSATARNGIAGLASGMNTDEIVDQMTLGTRSKIAKLQQKQTSIGWKMEAYQSVITSMLNFKDKYMSSLSSTNLRSESFFKSATITANGANASAVSVTGTTASAISNFSILGISHLAKTATFTSGKAASQGGIVTSDLSAIFDGGQDFTRSSLEGSSMTFNIKGESYSIQLSNIKTSSDPAENSQYIADAINQGLKNAGINGQLKAQVSGGKIQIAVDSSVGSRVTLEDASDAVKNVLGFAADATAPSGGSFTGSKNIEETSNMEKTQETKSGNEWLAGKSFTLNYNGTNRVISFGDNPTFGSVDDIVTHLNEQLTKGFGTTGTGASEVSKVSVENDNGKLVFTTEDATSILSLAYGAEGITGSTGLFGIATGAANRLLTNEAISKTNLNDDAKALVQHADFVNGTKGEKISINGTEFTVYNNKIVMNEGGSDAKTFEFSNGTTMNNIVSTINSADVGAKIQYNSATDNFTLTASESGTMGKVEIGGDLGIAIFGTEAQASTQKGEDAVMTVSFDGGLTSTTVTRNSNSFSLNGLNITLNKTFQEVAGEGITFTSTPNTDAIVDAIKEMVTAYNEMIDVVNGQLKTKPNSAYQPLTSEQRAEMSESEIKSWEENAKRGLLYGDSTLRTLASDLQFAFSMPVGDSALKSIGLSSSGWDSYGKLNIDEAKLRQAIEADPNKVAEIFTKTSSDKVGASSQDAGVMARMDSVMTKYANTLGTNKGLLVTMAGHESWSYTITESTLYKQIQNIAKDVERYQTQLKTEQDRYIRQFTSLETYISNMNAQSTWLSQMLGS